jgi:assimilatory nitrate reductase electron transfer subunit
VARIDRTARLAWLDDGSALPYDVLVLATGADPELPPVAGLANADGGLVTGAVAFRTRADCAAIDRLARDAAHAVVLGGGVLGLEAARALAGRGLPVTLVQRGGQLMERDLDAAAAAVLGRAVRGLGVRVRRGAGVAAVLGGPRVRGVRLDDGTVLDADLLVLCCGVRPRTELARAAGLAVGTGVVVDDQLRSSDPSILAIGDCAEHRGRGYGLVAPAWEQAAVAALGIARPSAGASYPGSVPVTRLKAADVELAYGKAVRTVKSCVGSTWCRYRGERGQPRPADLPVPVARPVLEVVR